MPQPKWGQVREFCRRLGCRETRTDHYLYVRVLPDRLVSRTMVHFGRDGDVVPSRMWLQLWKQQLKLASEDEFWRGLKGENVRYDLSPALEEGAPLPQYFHRFLRDVRRMSEEEIAALSRDEAQEILNQHCCERLREE